MIIFGSKSRGNTIQKAKGSVLRIRKQEVDVQLAKWIVGKRKQSRSGHLLLLYLCGRVIKGMREDTNLERRNGSNYFANKNLECRH